MGNGLLGLIVTLGLALAVVVLYRSMRNQMKKIDFDPDGATDAERMRGAGKRKDAERPADSEINGYHEPPPQV
jgi:hypothetical protein